jgi:hypothetical protein
LSNIKSGLGQGVKNKEGLKASINHACQPLRVAPGQAAKTGINGRFTLFQKRF